MNFDEMRDYLFGLRASGSRLGLDRMRLLCEQLGHPEQKIPVVHVAGTNGKGSVCVLVESALRAAGYRVGLFTSPHLVYLGERIQVDRVPIDPNALIALVQDIKVAADTIAKKDPEGTPTFFEFMTAAAFLFFAQKHVDIAVIETGLGGRFDSTNVVSPLVCAVSSIGFDHMDYLGDTLEKIAFEKAGIFKKGVPVVFGEMPAEAEAVLRAVAEKVESGSVFCVRDMYGENGRPWPMCALSGAHQQRNAATATLVLEALRGRFDKIDEDAIVRGFEQVVWDGRWQRIVLKDARTLILEGSHNPESAQVLAAELEALRGQTRAISIVCGVCGVVRARAILPVVARYAQTIYLAHVDEPRACSFDEMEAILADNGYTGKVSRVEVPVAFPNEGQCTIGEPSETIVVTGSLYLVGEVLGRVVATSEAVRGLGFQDLLPDPSATAARRR